MRYNTFYLFSQCGVELIVLIFAYLFNIYSFVVLLIIGSMMALLFLPSTLLYLCQNWLSSWRSFKKCCSCILDVLIIIWYLALVCFRIERFTLNCLNLNFCLASFNYILPCFIYLVQQPFLIFFMLVLDQSTQ